MPSNRVNTTGKYAFGSVRNLSTAFVVEVQIHATLQMDRAGEKFSGGNNHASPTGLRARVNRIADRRRAIGPAVGHGAVIRDGKITQGKHRCLNARQNSRHL